MKTNADLFMKEVSPKRLYTSVKEISSFHRIQVTQGFRDAANLVCKKLKDNGIEAKVLSYMADGDIWYLQNKMFQEWKIRKAVLYLDEPEMKLADYDEEAISVVQRSYPCDFSDGLELVYMDLGTDEKAYEDIDLKDKIIFTHENFHKFEWTFKKGIKGFVTDYIDENSSRNRHDLYHSLTYTSFWWKHSEDEIHPFGFVLSPCMGDILEKIYYERKNQGLKTILKGLVDSEMNPGVMEVVEAVLPGETDEEIILSSHLCHPKSSANDNASGCAANIEVLRVLKKLIDEGKIPKNKRTIKAIFMPEFTGTYAYLHDHNNYEKMMGALNLDMVGGRQTREYGPITLTLLPDSLPSIVQSLTHMCLDLAGRETDNLLDEKVSFTHYVTERFFGGSDHLVFSNPDFNIPCCMLGQWPDRNYHTATDKLEVIDPEVLAFSTRVALNFAYTLSNLKQENLPLIFEYLHKEMQESFKYIHEALADKKITDKMAYDCIVNKTNLYKKAVMDLKRLMPEVNEDILINETHFIETNGCLYLLFLGLSEGNEYKEDTRVYVKKFTGPIQSLDDNIAVSSDKAKEMYKTYTDKYPMFNDVADRCITYIDGKKDVKEIKKSVSLEFMKDTDETVENYLSLLNEMKMIEIIQ